MSRFQLSSCCFEVKLKNCRTFSATGSKTAQDHDTNTTIVYSFCSVLGLESLYSSKHPNSYFCGQRTQSLPHLTTKLYQKEFDLSVWAAAVKLEGINCGAEDSFLHPLSPGHCKTHITVHSDAGVPVFSRSCRLEPA